jgi:hypothetical protein
VALYQGLPIDCTLPMLCRGRSTPDWLVLTGEGNTVNKDQDWSIKKGGKILIGM